MYTTSRREETTRRAEWDRVLSLADQRNTVRAQAASEVVMHLVVCGADAAHRDLRIAFESLMATIFYAGYESYGAMAADLSDLIGAPVFGALELPACRTLVRWLEQHPTGR